MVKDSLELSVYSLIPEKWLAVLITLQVTRIETEVSDDER